MFGRYYSGKRRDDDFAGAADITKKENRSFRAALHEVGERRNRALEADTTASLDKMFTPDAAKIPDRDGSNRPARRLLHEIAPGRPATRSSNPDMPATRSHESRIVETQILVKLRPAGNV